MNVASDALKATACGPPNLETLPGFVTTLVEALGIPALLEQKYLVEAKVLPSDQANKVSPGVKPLELLGELFHRAPLFRLVALDPWLTAAYPDAVKTHIFLSFVGCG